MDLVEALEKEAQSRGISTSTLMNQAIDRCVYSIWPSEKSGVISLAQNIVKGFLDHMSVEAIVKVGAITAQEHKLHAMILYGTQPKLESVLKMLEKITAIFSMVRIHPHG